MGKKSINGNGVRASFDKLKNGRLSINFFDPAYIHADTIIVNRLNGEVHAVVYESSYFIGHMDAGLSKELVHGEDIELSAIHFSGKQVRLKAPVSLS